MSDDEPRLSWFENEILNALKRLANARSKLELLEEQGEAADPAMLDFARREVTSAEREMAEVQALDVPADGVDIDLTVEPPATS